MNRESHVKTESILCPVSFCPVSCDLTPKAFYTWPLKQTVFVWEYPSMTFCLQTQF